MGIFSDLLAEFRTNPAADIDWGGFFGRGIETAAGVSVTNQNSLQVSAVFACVRVLAESVASLPLILYRRRPAGERGKDRAIDHYLYPILHDLANPEMTAYELRETAMGHVCTWGNGYSEIEFNRAGEVAALWPLRPDRMKVTRRKGRIWYVYQMPEGSSTKPYVELPMERVFHLRGLGYDGMVGYDPIAMARQTIGLSKGTEEFGARFFGNGAQTGTVYEHPGKLSDTAYDRLSKSIERRHQGLEKAHRIMILEEGMKANQVSIPPENAQFLETRKFQVTEIARWFRVPPHMLADLERATFSNIEQMSLDFVIYSLMPWLIRWEKTIYRCLLTPRERMELFAEHLVDGLLRGDIQTRYQAYATGRQWGWLSANDVRERENDNPVEGGDEYLVPLNMIPAGMAGEMGSPPSPPEGGAEAHGSQGAEGDRSLRNVEERRAQQVAMGRQRLARAMQRVIEDTVGRVLRREINDVRRAVKKFFGKRDAQQFSLWLTQFYEDHREFWQRQMLPVLMSYADQVGASVADELGGEPKTAEDVRKFIDAYALAMAKRQVSKSIGTLQGLLDQALTESSDPAEAIEGRLDDWEESRAAQEAHKETFTANNALAVAFYGLASVTVLYWVAFGESCAYCNGLNGRKVGIDKFFLAAGEDFKPDGADSPLKPRSNMRHPPAHDGCDCMVIAG